MLHLLNKPKRKKKSGIGAITNPFDPFTYNSANLISIYDGDTYVPADFVWNDASGNGHNLTMFNVPTESIAALNGHDTVIFNGIDQYGTSLTPNIPQPSTHYIVFKAITWTNLDRVFDGNAIVNTRNLYQSGATPNIALYSGVLLSDNPGTVLNNYNLYTCVFNGANSHIRTNNNVAVIGDAGNLNSVGTNLCAAGGGAGFGFGNMEIAYVILRSSADSTAVQNLFINWLKTRFAI
jgi:hypothetical protein